jgi:hypothetical protein
MPVPIVVAPIFVSEGSATPLLRSISDMPVGIVEPGVVHVQQRKPK